VSDDAPGVGRETSLDPDHERVPATNEQLVEHLEGFLDELATGHRRRMEEVVAWLNEHADLDEEIESSVEVLSPLFQRWSIEICFVLRMHGVLRFNELKRTLDGIGSRTLSRRLDELQEQGIVHREAYAEVPVRVEYSLTEKGERLGDLMLPVIAHLRLSRLREDGLLPGADGS
jgi:DNA-binding HxlR family transcriptional regulator